MVLKNGINFRDIQIWNDCARRGQSRGGIARVWCKRYLFLLERSLWLLDLTFEEARILCEALERHYDPDTGINIDSFSLVLLPAKIEDFLKSRQHLKDTTLDLDPEILLEKLYGYSDCQIFTLVDAVEQFWCFRQISDSSEDWHTELRAAGLVRG